MKTNAKIYIATGWIVVLSIGFTYGIEWLSCASDVLNIVSIFLFVTLGILTKKIYKLLTKKSQTNEKQN